MPQVLALRITPSDGIAYEGDLLRALWLLANQVTAATQGDMALMINVVSLPLGYFSETEGDMAYLAGLGEAVDALLEMGVVVVASAGDLPPAAGFTLPH